MTLRAVIQSNQSSYISTKGTTDIIHSSQNKLRIQPANLLGATMEMTLIQGFMGYFNNQRQGCMSLLRMRFD